MEREIPSPKGSLKWSRSTVGRILRNSTYAGKTYAGKTAMVGGRRVALPQDKWVEIPGAVDRAAFTWEEWQGIQKQIDRNAELSPRRQKLYYALRGRVFCSACGRKYRGVPIHGYPYYRCAGHSRLVADVPCRSRSVNGDRLWDAVWGAIASELRHPDVLAAEIERRQQSGENTLHLRDQRDICQRRITDLDQTLDRYLRMYGSGLWEYERVERETKRVNRAMTDAKRELEDLDARILTAGRHQADAEAIRRTLDLLGGRIDHADEETKQLALEHLDIGVWVGPDKVSIEGSLPTVDSVSPPL